MNLENILQIVMLSCSFLFACISVIITLVRKKRKNEEITTTIMTDTFLENFLTCMEISEESLGQLKRLGIDSSSTKKNDVLTKLQNYCLMNNISYKAEELSAWVDRLVKFAHTINKK